ncbi:MAG: hypothetical protein EOL90_01935 [Spartobacteria bacterium]|nr:hypothetical protein [Spartobacteria bacterium]
MKRLAILIASAVLLGLAPAGAQDAPPAPAEESRSAALDALYAQADGLIRQIQSATEPARSLAVEDLRRVLTQIDADYDAAEKAASARRQIEGLRAAVARQRLRLTEAGRAMALAKNANPPDPAAVHARGSDYTLQEAILLALEEKVKHEARRQSLGTSEALRWMQEVE